MAYQPVDPRDDAQLRARIRRYTEQQLAAQHRGGAMSGGGPSGGAKRRINPDFVRELAPLLAPLLKEHMGSGKKCECEGGELLYNGKAAGGELLYNGKAAGGELLYNGKAAGKKAKRPLSAKQKKRVAEQKRVAKQEGCSYIEAGKILAQRRRGEE